MKQKHTFLFLFIPSFFYFFSNRLIEKTQNKTPKNLRFFNMMDSHEENVCSESTPTRETDQICKARQEAVQDLLKISVSESKIDPSQNSVCECASSGEMFTALQLHAPLLVDFVGPETLKQETNFFHLSRIDKALFCACHYVPPEHRGDPELQTLMRMCGSWQKRHTRDVINLAWTLDSSVDKLRSRSCRDLASREPESIQFNTCPSLQLGLKSYLMGRIDELEAASAQRWEKK